MTEAIVAAKSPVAVEVEAGKTYFWCSCGRSDKQPFCDGSHRETSLAPVKYEAVEDSTVYFCACKQTGNQPRCDGSHQKIG